MTNRRDFIPRMRKIPAVEGIRIVRSNEMSAIDALRINGVHLTDEDKRWLSRPGYKYIVSSVPHLGTIAAIRGRL